MPSLARRRFGALQLVTWGLPLALALLLSNVILSARAGAARWALRCVASYVWFLLGSRAGVDNLP